MNLFNAQWQKFKLSDLFDCELPPYDLKTNSVIDGDDCLITTTNFTNGLGRYIYNDDVTIKPYSGNKITLNMFGYAFYQEREFYTVGHGHVNILTPKFQMTQNIALFICTLINFERFRYSFGRAVYSNMVDEIKIALPVDKTGKPNYGLMEKYIAKLDCDVSDIPEYFFDEGHKKACWYLDNIDTDKFESEYAGIKQKKGLRLTDRKWKDFCLGDKNYFVVQRGKSEYIKNAGVGDTPYVSTTNENNGILNYTGLCNRDGNLISLAYDGTIGACFYQDKPFFASEKIVTIDLVEVELNQYIAMFLIPILQLKSKLYSYGGRKWAVNEQMLKSSIKLPVNSAGNPDYQFMEDYIKSLPFSAKL